MCETNTNQEGKQDDQEEIISVVSSQSNALNEPIMVDQANSPTIISTLNENLLPQLNNSIPTKLKPLISPKNKKRLRVETKEYESSIYEIHESLVISSFKKRKKTHSKEERMELAQQAINSGNIKNF